MPVELRHDSWLWLHLNLADQRVRRHARRSDQIVEIARFSGRFALDLL
jgi:hypothetical protein